jgi:hypothetical protein
LYPTPPPPNRVTITLAKERIMEAFLVGVLVNRRLADAEKTDK